MATLNSQRKISSTKDSDSLGALCFPNSHPKVIEFIDYIFQESTVAGLKYIGATKYKTVERIFWVIAVLSCVGFSLYLVENVIEKFIASPVIISFQAEETDISRIPFPAITICNVNMLKRSILNREIDKELERIRRKDLNGTLEGAYVIETLAQYCFATPSFRRQIRDKIYDAGGRQDVLEMLEDFIARFNETVVKSYESFEHVARRKARQLYREASPKCSDMILKCSWSGEEIPCNETFFPLETSNGHCCTFNMMPKFILQNISMEERRAQREEDRLPPDVVSAWQNFSHEDLISMNKKNDNITYPKYQSTGGKPYGLTILVNPELDEYSTCKTNDGMGFMMVAHSPVSLPSIRDFGVAVPPGSEAFVDVEPSVTSASMEELQDIEIEKRGCIFYSDDQADLEHFNFYSNENCLSECMSIHIYKNCSCVLHFLPHKQGQRLCGILDGDCLKSVIFNLTMSTGDDDYCGKCKPACTEFDYKLQLSHFDMRDDFASSNFEYHSAADGSLKNASQYSILHIFFGTDTIYVKERKVLYNTADLIANAGGLLSLTLGVSIVSAIEFVYFFTLRAYFQYRSIQEEKESLNASHNPRSNHGDCDNGDDDETNQWTLKHYRLNVKVASYATKSLGELTPSS